VNPQRSASQLRTWNFKLKLKLKLKESWLSFANSSKLWSVLPSLLDISTLRIAIWSHNNIFQVFVIRWRDSTQENRVFFIKLFRHPWPDAVSWPWQPWRSRDRRCSSLQRSNGGGGFRSSGLNISTRVSKNGRLYTSRLVQIGLYSRVIPNSNRLFPSRFRGCQCIFAGYRRAMGIIRSCIFSTPKQPWTVLDSPGHILNGF
jgi:hypothetical protein